jgi:hypothetical protein
MWIIGNSYSAARWEPQQPNQWGICCGVDPNLALLLSPLSALAKINCRPGFIQELAVLSRETLERYRRMTIDERFALAMQMIEENMPALLAGPPEIVQRRFELLRRQNDERNRNMLEAIARTRTSP